MFNYIKGKVMEYGPNYISLENNGIGFMIFVPNPYAYKEDTEYKVYIYSHIREEEYTLYGFRNEQERDFFLKLRKKPGPAMKPTAVTKQIRPIFLSTSGTNRSK